MAQRGSRRQKRERLALIAVAETRLADGRSEVRPDGAGKDSG